MHGWYPRLARSVRGPGLPKCARSCGGGWWLDGRPRDVAGQQPPHGLLTLVATGPSRLGRR